MSSVRSSDVFFAPHSSIDNFDDITKPFDSADVAIEIGGKRLYFVRSIFPSQSPVFCTLLYTIYSKGTIKDNCSALQVVPLFDVDFQSFQSFLLVLVPAPHRQNIITEENVEKLLDIAHKYETYAVIGRCACFIQLYWKEKSCKVSNARSRQIFSAIGCLPSTFLNDASSANLPPDFYAALLHGKLNTSCCKNCRSDCNRGCCYYYKCTCTTRATMDDKVIERAVKFMLEKPTTNKSRQPRWGYCAIETNDKLKSLNRTTKQLLYYGRVDE